VSGKRLELYLVGRVRNGNEKKGGSFREMKSERGESTQEHK